MREKTCGPRLGISQTGPGTGKHVRHVGNINSLGELDPGEPGNLLHVRFFIRGPGNHAEKLFAVGSKDDSAGINGGNAKRLPQGLVCGDLFLRGVGIHEMLNIKTDHSGTYCGGIFL